jgi:6-pyruvoyl-tetrahydropterin synthase
MDDFDSGILSQAKSEYAARLVTILSPLVLEGIKSIFSEALDMCKENEEEDKYLMTFQNFLSRIIKWNSEIITNETKRIITKSGCNYLEDLLTCVHIAQLKILTSVRVGQKQKKIDIDIPKLDNFIHKIYIFVARKIYKNVYLYERFLPPLNYQKNMREAEIMCKESIFEVIRDTIPVEKILRAYIDETVDEEIIQETNEIVTDDVSNNAVLVEAKEKLEKTTETKSDAIIIKKDDTPKPTKENIADIISSEVKAELNQPISKAPENILPTTNVIKPSLVSVVTEPAKVVVNSDVVVEQEAKKIVSEQSPKSGTRLTFNNLDSVLDMGTNKIKDIVAPKTLERLEQISNIRNEQRKIEEEEEDDDEEKLVIGGSVNLNKDILGIKTLGGGIKLNEPELTGIEVLA